jgi:hypothetical protein
MSKQAADRAAAQREAGLAQSRMNQAGVVAQHQEAARREQKVQDEIRRLQARSGELSNDASNTRNVTPEQWAAMHGMTLEEWVRGGKKPAY